MRGVWVALFLALLVFFLWVTVGWGVLALYVLANLLGEPAAWPTFGLWLASAVGGGVLLVAVMKRTCPDARGSKNAES